MIFTPQPSSRVVSSTAPLLMSSQIAEILEHEQEHDETEAGNYFVANYPPFSFWDAETAATCPESAPTTARARECRSAFISTCRSAGSAATSATSASIPTRTPTRSSAYLDSGIRELELYARTPLIDGTQAEVRLFRRRHAALSIGVATHVADRSDESVAAVGRGGGSHLRMRAGDAHRAEARRDARDRRHAALPRRRKLRRAHSRDQRARTSHRRNLPRLRIRAIDRLPADQHRSDRRHGRGDRRELARKCAQDDRAAARQRDDLPDGSAVQHGHLSSR